MRGVTVDGGPVDRIVYARLADRRAGQRARRLPGPAQLLPPAQAGDQPDAGARPRRPRAAVPADLQAGLGPARAASSRSASRRGWPWPARSRRSSALAIDAGDLLLTDWLPPWGGWDDAVCLVFDGGVHDPAVLDAVVKQERRDPRRAVLHARRGARARRRLHRPPRRGRRVAGDRTSGAGGVPRAAGLVPADRPAQSGAGGAGCLHDTGSTTSPRATRTRRTCSGGKGANLAEMTNLGLPVPPGSPSPPRPAAPTCARAASPTAWPRRSPSTCDASRTRWAARSATPATRCWSACARGRSSRCPG